MDKNNKLNISSTFLLYLGIATFTGLIIIVNIFHYTYKINADIGSEVALAKTIWDSRSWIPSAWYPSTELRLISTPNLAAVFYGLTGNAVLSTGMACCAMSLGIVLSISYFMKAINAKPGSRLLMVFLCLMVPSTFGSLELLYLFAGYYAIHIIVLFLVLGFYASSIANRRVSWQLFLLPGVLAFMLGIQGVRGILITFGPLLAVELLRSILLFFKEHQTRIKDFKLLTAAALLTALSFLGTQMPVSVGQGVRRNLRRGFHKFVNVVIPDIVRAIGFEAGNNWKNMILGSFCLLLFIAVFRLVRKLCRHKELSPTEWSFAVLAVSPLLTAVISAFTTVDSSERYYFIFIFVMAMSVILLIDLQNKKMNIVITIMILLLTAVNFQNIYLPVLTSDEPPQSDTLAVAEYLREHEYQVAYAEFEYASVISVLAQMEVIVAPVADVAGMSICKWLSYSDWYVPNRPEDEKIAIIVTEPELSRFTDFLEEKGYTETVVEDCSIGRYWIYKSDKNISTLTIEEDELNV